MRYAQSVSGCGLNSRFSERVEFHSKRGRISPMCSPFTCLHMPSHVPRRLSALLKESRHVIAVGRPTERASQTITELLVIAPAVGNDAPPKASPN